MKTASVGPSLSTQVIILRALTRFLFRLMMTALVFAFCFYLLIVSNMGGAYFQDINNGALDLPIRLALIGISAWIAFSAVTWLVWRTFQDIRKIYQQNKRKNIPD